MKRYKLVDDYIDFATQWQAELRQLRKLLNRTKLDETVIWGAPCYAYMGKNVVGLGLFKRYVGLWFFQRALLEHSEGVLINAQEGKMHAMRQ